MQFTEMGKKDGKTLLLLPGTACTWQLNFRNVIEDLSRKYHVIAVNYDGFEGDREKIFPDMLTETERMEEYILENHDGHVDGAYGSSLGGSFAGLLLQRKRIHMDHVLIGSSDLDQGGKVKARLLTMLVGPLLSGACTSEKKRESMKAKMKKKVRPEDGDGALEFAEAFIDSMKDLNPETISRQFYSDYITPLEDDIHAEGTSVHVIYAMKMGKKYEARYRRHFRNPDIHAFDMKHEAWMMDDHWKAPVLATIDQCMGICEEEMDERRGEDTADSLEGERD